MATARPPSPLSLSLLCCAGNTCDQARLPSSNAKCKFYLWIWFLATNNSAQHTRHIIKTPKFWFDKLIQIAGDGSTSRSCCWRRVAVAAAVLTLALPVRDPAAVGRWSACQKFTIYHLWLTCARVKIIKYAAGSGAHHTHTRTHTQTHPYTPIHAHALCWHVLPWPRGTSDHIVQEIKNWGNEIWLLVSAAR